MPQSRTEASHAASGPALPLIASLPVDAALAALHSSFDGLYAGEAQSRYRTGGPNAIAHEPRHAILRQFLTLLASPLSLLLLALSAINFFTGQALGAIVIAVMVVLSSLLAFVQEYRSNHAAERLRSMVGTTVTVVRRKQSPARDEGNPADRIPLERVVPGDIVTLSVGDLIPADVRFIAATDLFVDQAALTGESLPVEKFPHPLNDTGLPLLELGNIGFMGTYVVSGSARALVVVTGARTSFGHVATTLSGARQMTSFDRGVHRFIGLILAVMMVMVPLVFLINGLTKGNWLEAMLFAVAVAVGLAPEMLPMIVTINLAKGALAMSGKKVIVKRLNAIQDFGAMDVLCTDKTGTLTQNKVILEKHVDIFGHDSQRVTEYAYLNSYHQTGLKNLLDLAVLKYVHVHERLKADTGFRKIDEIPFDFARRRMSVILEQADGARLLICKGAVEEVLSVCTTAEQDGAPLAIAGHHVEALGKVVQQLNDDGFRVIAIACKRLPASQAVFSLADEAELTLVGYIAFLDPPKDSAAEAIQALHGLGIGIVVLSGDNAAVCSNVCRHVGLQTGHIFTGAEIDAMGDDALAAAARQATVFAKMAPQQKSRVIRALQGHGRVVGYLGDGINDGPALRAADVGISVDGAVDIARESADIILLKKSLLSLRDGVVEGRKVFGNITKYIKMSASSNFGNMLSVLGASSLLPFLPMAPVQILLNNLLYDFSQTTLATDHVDPEYVGAPRRWDIVNIGRYMLCLGPASSLFDYVTFGVLWFGLGAAHAPGVFQTGWFVESLLSQTLIVHVIRTSHVPFVQSSPSLPLLVTTAMICLLGLWLPYSPLAGALGFVVPPAGYWRVLPAIILAYLAFTQLLKSWLVRRFGLN